MKLFHTENGKQLVYVQLKDIKYLTSFTSLPEEVTSVIFSVFDDFDVDASTQFNFVCFDEEAVIFFFKELDFIIDYDAYKHFTEEQFKAEKTELVKKANFFANLHRNMSDGSKRNTLKKERDNVLYKLDSIQELMKFKHHQLSMTIPKHPSKEKSSKSKSKKSN